MTRITPDRAAELEAFATAINYPDAGFAVATFRQAVEDLLADRAEQDATIAKLRVENERLRTQATEAEAWAARTEKSWSREQEHVREKRAANERLLRRADAADALTATQAAWIEKAIGALEPFAKEAARWAAHWSDDECIDEAGFCLGQLRTAARLLSELQSREEPS